MTVTRPESHPLIRMDDYPTGVRPVLEDMTPLHMILRKFDDAALMVHLGVVPALLTDDMADFLRSLRHLVPVAHGFDHGYPRLVSRLIEHEDPFNEKRTVRRFDEFKGVSTATITEKLSEGRRILEDRLGCCVTGYIPPCNCASWKTGRALVRAGFTHYLSERKIRFCKLPCLGSDFYGRSSEYDYSRQPRSICLHLTWEFDLIRKGDTGSLDRLVDHLLDRQSETGRDGQHGVETDL